MTHRTVSSFGMALSMSAAILAPHVAMAQSAGATSPVSGFVTVNAGLVSPANDTFGASDIDASGINRDELKTEYHVDQGPGFDIGGGVLIQQRFIVGVAVSHFQSTEPASATVTLTHPLFHPDLTAMSSADELEYSETGTHIQFGYRIPLPGPLQLSMFGGPSHFSLSQPLIADLRVTETLNPVTRVWSASVRDIETERQTASAWGYHVGADLGVSLTNYIGIGALVRYSQATVSLEDPLLSYVQDRSVPQDVEAGGLQIMGGIRIRF